MKRQINVFEYANEIMTHLQKGVLLTTQSKGKVNTMTISWGSLGIEWNKPIFITYVRESRHTKKMLDENPEFTINIPVREFDKKILGFCGTQSGVSVDKIKHLDLTLEDSEVISVPGIKELPLTLECKVIYKQAQEPNAIMKENRERFYPKDVSGDFHGANADYHTVYYGEIINAYIIEE